MKGKIVILLIMAATALSACSSTNTSSDIASLYTGYESGSWYKFSRNCSAKLCPAY